MKLAETVTFGGSGFDRAAELRSDPAALAALQDDPATRALVFWRGKPLVTGDPAAALGLLAPGHALLALAAAAPVFLGRDGDGARFAYDISGWQPEGLDAADLGAFFDRSEQHHPDLPADWRFAELRGAMARLSAREAELAAIGRALLEWHRTHGFCARCGARSDIAEGGWMRLCADCGGHHFPRSDPVVIMLVTRGNSVLVGRSHGWPERMYSLLAGFVEPGETIEAAVRREVAEETGIRIGRVDYLASQPWPFPTSLMIGCHGQAESTHITVDPAEIEDARWLTREEMVQVFAREHPEVAPARRGAIAHFLLTNWLADRLA